MMFCCDSLFLFPDYFCSSVNKMDSDYLLYVVNASELVKPYSFMTFVNVGNDIIAIEPVLISFTMYSGELKVSST